MILILLSLSFFSQKKTVAGYYGFIERTDSTCHEEMEVLQRDLLGVV
ncbi:MAG: hypothetical protein KME32_23610 [Mojavia pulchra JT2-VF2]|jgi:hypothetical protein|uniref:Uncharacterized protein n=1 Tax=Mojavia pulchra JT2-VF2 TaxID=287848 RepID=A0A951Q2G0_9NOST|nr:hypothetical protein [Mojavia pulchra JT2-VF2]